MSPQPEEDSPHRHPTTGIQQNEFTPDERHLLLALAHEAIISKLEGREISLQAPIANLAVPRGVFATIYLRGALHGCVGLVLPAGSLYRNVAEMARAAAFEDTRFPAITRSEASDLAVSLSILSPLFPIVPENIEIGRHGLFISKSGQGGLLLPQVPAEQRWDRLTFLEQTCRKAGLPLDAWKSGASIEAFTAEVFGDQR